MIHFEVSSVIDQDKAVFFNCLHFRQCAVPHFEKMLYDQGQLVNVYLDAFVIWKETQYALVARDILDYLRREMTHADGGIFSAEDADSAEFEGAARKKEGAFYVWTNQEVCSDFPYGM